MSDLIYDERLMRLLSISAGVTKSFHDLFEPYALPTRPNLERYYESLDCNHVIGSERDILLLFLHELKNFKRGRMISFMNCEFNQSIYQGKILGRLCGASIVNADTSPDKPDYSQLGWAENPLYKESSIDAVVIPLLNATPSTLEQTLEKTPEYREHLQVENLIIVFNGSQEKDDIKGIGTVIERYLGSKNSIGFRALDGRNQEEISRVWSTKAGVLNLSKSRGLELIPSDEISL